MTYDVALLVLKVMKIKIISIQYHENRIGRKSNDNFLRQTITMELHAITFIRLVHSNGLDV